MQSIYIVDDDLDDLMFVTLAFEKFQSAVTLKTFSNGHDLLKDLRGGQDPPAFVLLDINMPLISGIETLQIIRQTPGIAHLPVIMFSTTDCQPEKSESFIAGANDFISKPASVNGYDKIVSQLISRWLVNA